MKPRKRLQYGFTLVELSVSIALIIMILGFSAIIFNSSIDSYRLSQAHAEVMMKFRVITDQLKHDFKGLRKDGPILVWFEQSSADPDQRFDQIMFFAEGDFQSYQPYDLVGGFLEPTTTGTQLHGNLARIYYGHAQSLDPNGAIQIPQNLQSDKRKLARRMHVLSAHPDLRRWYSITTMADMDNTRGGTGPSNMYNEIYEHDALSLPQWKAVALNLYDFVITTCFGTRPWINERTAPQETLQKLLSSGVSSFRIQWAYWDDNQVTINKDSVLWYPDNNPAGDGTKLSHFQIIERNLTLKNAFGVYFHIKNQSGSLTSPDWYEIGDNALAYEQNAGSYLSFDGKYFPDALKFTFRLYDSKKLLKGGREFSYIVYLDD